MHFQLNLEVPTSGDPRKGMGEMFNKFALHKNTFTERLKIKDSKTLLRV